MSEAAQTVLFFIWFSGVVAQLVWFPLPAERLSSYFYYAMRTIFWPIVLLYLIGLFVCMNFIFDEVEK